MNKIKYATRKVFSEFNYKGDIYNKEI